jgi:hypothetical protein
MYNKTATQHSSLLGFLFDSFPIYGPYGYSSANISTSGVKRMVSSYQKRNITNRYSYANGTCSPTAGPSITTSYDSTTNYSIGAFLDDYQYIAGSGDLDQFNGRWCVTPE